MPKEEDIHRVQAIVHGYVQGVGFRYFVLEMARRLELVGWVHNLSDGSVETVAEGKKEAIDEFLASLEQGPRGARVSKLETSWQPPSREFRSFSVRLF